MFVGHRYAFKVMGKTPRKMEVDGWEKNDAKRVLVFSSCGCSYGVNLWSELKENHTSPNLLFEI